MDKKKIIIGLLCLVIVGCIGLSIYKLFKDRDDEVDNTSGLNIVDKEEVLKDTSIDKLSVSNQVLMVENEISSYMAVLSNDSDEDYEISKLYVVFSLGEEEVKSLVLIDTKIDGNGSKDIDIVLDRDLSDVTKIEYVMED